MPTSLYQSALPRCGAIGGQSAYLWLLARQKTAMGCLGVKACAACHQRPTDRAGSFPLRGLCVSPLVSYSARAGSTRATYAVSGLLWVRPIQARFAASMRALTLKRKEPTGYCAPGAATPPFRAGTHESVGSRAIAWCGSTVDKM